MKIEVVERIAYRCFIFGKEDGWEKLFKQFYEQVFKEEGGLKCKGG